MRLKEMIDKPIVYKFSTLVLLLVLPVLMLFVIPILGLVYAGFFYSNILGIVIAIPACIILYDVISNYLWFCYCLLMGKPALILSKDSFVDNINRQVYKWEDVDQIGFHPKGDFSGYLWMRLNNLGKYKGKTAYRWIIAKLNKKFFAGPFMIQPNLIKGKRKEIVGTIMKWHSIISLNAK